MVNGIGKVGAGTIQPAAQGTGRASGAGKAGAPSPERPAFGGSSIVADLARMGPPVDADKVSAIRAAIAGGRYPVNPDRIAEAMLALDLPSQP
ncbi:MAG: flagellar biosynthesis anti-sigma factor FlgM [Sphingomonadales bacterium]